jgi:Uma2 family endonuclease
MAVAPTEGRITRERYIELVERGVIRADERVELLEGVIVSMAPQDPRHAFAIVSLQRALQEAIGTRATIRAQLPLDLGAYSMPEPDVAVVPGCAADYVAAHPSTALLVVEVAGRSLAQDRLTKGAMYAAAGIPDYWIVDLRDDRVEVLRAPITVARRYAERRLARRGERIELLTLPGAAVAVADFLPAR